MFAIIDPSEEYINKEQEFESLSAVLDLILETGYRYVLIKSNSNIISKKSYGKRIIIQTFCLLNQCENRKVPIKAIHLDRSSNALRWIKHPEVSFVFMDVVDAMDIIDRGLINLARQYYKFIGIDFKPLFYRDDRYKLIRAIKKRLVQYLNKSNVRYVFFIRIESPYDLISPRQLRSMLMLIGIKDYIIKQATKIMPRLMLVVPYEFQKRDNIVLELDTNN